MNGLDATGLPLLVTMALLGLWMGSAIVVTRTSSLRTSARYLHALLSFPVVVVLLPLVAYGAAMIAPHLTPLISAQHALASLSVGGRSFLAETLSIGLAGLLPALLFWRYCRFIEHREARTLERLRTE